MREQEEKIMSGKLFPWDWIFDNLNEGAGGKNHEWQTISMVTCWQLSTWRNKTIFGDAFNHPINPTQVILKMSREIDSCMKTNFTGMPKRMNTIFIGWKRPQEGWVKLNCNGTHKSSVNLSVCGGLLRDSSGICLVSYAHKLGTCDALHAEMWGMYLGIDLTLRQGITHLQVDSDSKVLVHMVTGNCTINGSIPTLVRRIRDLKSMNWQVHINHTWCEGNKSTD
ncbi:hypothetical protein TSUD_214780 [Trifolium subterraneum]|uniref:RNase H type-1 domain-containing protein n=1 Tax=Trifolium subterraneum TaxID=3900 RepID=A0A2Z6N221_TRISU|nr:hypothetical protein TSUD_214780 [Trifolium subterraneum]